MNRRLLHRLILRELRALFQQHQRRPVETRVPQNIWEGNYFRELEDHIEEDNARIREAVPRRPLYEVGPIEDPPERSKDPPRNLNNLYTILDEMELHLSFVKQVIFIHKSYGLFEINIASTSVDFIPSICLHCNHICSERKRFLCIVQDPCSNPGTGGIIDYNSSMENLEFHAKDLLLLSKAIALEYNLLPDHVINQMQRRFYYKNQDPFIIETMRWLRIFMLREFDRLNEYGPDPPEMSALTARAQLQQELRALFQRRHQHDPPEGEDTRDGNPPRILEHERPENTRVENPQPQVLSTIREQLEQELRALYRQRGENEYRRAERHRHQGREEHTRPLGSPSVQAELIQELQNVFQSCERMNVPNNNETNISRNPPVQYGITARGEIIFELRDLFRRARSRREI